MLYIALAAAAGLIGLDQLTKILIDSNMQLPVDTDNIIRRYKCTEYHLREKSRSRFQYP